MKNNRGSSLILVIICIAFAGILGATILMASATNRDMKLVDEMAKENFYQTESGLDIFMANLSQMAEDVMGEAYTYVLTHYSPDNDAQLKAEVKKNLFYKLTGTPYGGDKSTALVDKKFLETCDGEETLFYGVDPAVYGTGLRLLNLDPVGDIDSLYAVVDGDDILIPGLCVSFMENGYETTITTDIRVKVEFTRLDVETPVTVKGDYVDYSIITDKNIIVPEGSSTVSGNVYAGDCLVADNNGDLKLTARRLIAASQVRTERGGSLDISGLDGHVEVWTKNIQTVKDVTGATGGQKIIIKNAECYVADDMTIGSENSEVRISGNYYGYTTLGGGESLADSSAVVINAGKSTLDLEGLNVLWLAGRSSLKVPDIYGGDKSASAYREIMEGEAVSYKGNQLAYLVPGECIREYGHNPLTKSEYEALNGNIVDTSVKFGSDGKMELKDYAAANPCEVVPVRFLSEKEPLYYIYIRFKSSAAAMQYFLEYSKVNKSQLDTYAKVLELGSVLLPGKSSIKTNGTVLRVNDKHQITEIISGTIDAGEAFDKQSELKRKFSGLVAMLDENYSGVSGGSLVGSIVRLGELPAGEEHLYFNKEMERVEEADPDGFEVIVSGRDVALQSKEFRGIVIAKGKITMQGGNFCGMLLATDDITLRSTKVTGGSSFLEELIGKNAQLQRYFMNYPLPPAGGEGGEEAAARNISVSIENWKKN